MNYGRVIYSNPRAYYVHIERRFIFRTWVQEPVYDSYTDGYWEMDDYPYYVHEGYRYRYNPVETCHYQLVDGEDYQIAQDYSENACDYAYNECAVDRDAYNTQVGSDRFFCGEAVDPDLSNDGTGYTPLPDTQSAPAPIPTPVPVPRVNPALQAQIDSLAGQSNKDIWKMGWNEGIGSCVVVKLSGNPLNCRWIVKSNELWMPMADGSVCSQDIQAAQVGCNVGNEKENIGCILKQVVVAGKCL